MAGAGPAGAKTADPPTLGTLAGVALLLIPGRVTARDEVVAVEPFALQGLDGRVFDSAIELPGKLTILSFWRLEQEYSRRLLLDPSQLRAEFAKERVNIVALAVDAPSPRKVAE